MLQSPVAVAESPQFILQTNDKINFASQVEASTRSVAHSTDQMKKERQFQIQPSALSKTPLNNGSSLAALTLQ